MDCQPAVVFGIRARDSSQRSVWVAGAQVIMSLFTILVVHGPCRRAVPLTALRVPAHRRSVIVLLISNTNNDNDDH